MINKNDIRKKYLLIRKKINNKDIKSRIIMEKIIDDDYFKNSKVIALYKSLKNEVNTDYIIDYCLKNNKIVLLPRVVLNDLLFYTYSLDDKLEKSNIGILEPIDNHCNCYDGEKIDLVIVPGVCFSENGDRLGYGKGYYDRFLKGKNVKSIGICFKEQLCNRLPINIDDYKLDKVISD